MIFLSTPSSAKRRSTPIFVPRTFGISALVVATGGLAVEGYDEAPVTAHLKGSEIEIGVDLGLGDGRATVWTCDLTHGHISINADYRS